MSLVEQLCPPAVALQADSRREQPRAPSSTPNQALLGRTPAQPTLTILGPVDWVRFSLSRTALSLRIDLRSRFAQVLRFHCTLILSPEGP
jgi:hypothetical protein